LKNLVECNHFVDKRPIDFVSSRQRRRQVQIVFRQRVKVRLFPNIILKALAPRE
jgi:hypothetical protein